MALLLAALLLRLWWWARLDSNQEPTDYEPDALTIELRARALTISEAETHCTMPAANFSLPTLPASLKHQPVHFIFLSRAAPVRKITCKHCTKFRIERLASARPGVAVHHFKSLTNRQTQPVSFQN